MSDIEKNGISIYPLAHTEEEDTVEELQVILFSRQYPN
jgi:hypothetical protein